MLMRRATASVSFRTQVVLVYLQYISVKIHSKYASQPKITTKNSLKTHILGFKVVQCHRCWYPGKLVSSACYDKQQQVCLSATVLLLDWTAVAKTARFERVQGCTQI